MPCLSHAASTGCGVFQRELAGRELAALLSRRNSLIPFPPGLAREDVRSMGKGDMGKQSVVAYGRDARRPAGHRRAGRILGGLKRRGYLSQ